MLGFVSLFAIVLAYLLSTVHSYLAVSNPIGSGILVVEAWVNEETLAEAANIFQQGRYRYLVVVGGQMQEGSGIPNSPSYVDVAANTLEKGGFDKEKLIKISSRAESSLFGRTLASAESVNLWLDSSKVDACCVDVLTAGVHARKSWILFRYVLGDRYRVGIIAGSPTSYDPKFWLISRRGIWLVARNLAGCAYSKLWIRWHRGPEWHSENIQETDKLHGFLCCPPVLPTRERTD